jgi:RNA polymerase sigma factor (sigma-70 family)
MGRGVVVQANADRELEARRQKLTELFVRHGPDALRLAYLMTGDRALAEDLAQEAMARLVGRFAHLRDPSAFGAYLRRTVVNLCRMHFRRRRIERAYLRSRSASVEALAIDVDLDLRQDLWDALRRLPDRQRIAIVLHYYEDLAEDQAAEILRCSAATYRSLVFRAKNGLRTLMKGDTDE